MRQAKTIKKPSPLHNRRFWPGKIHFTKSITISTEHGNHNDTPANYSSLVYYYYVPE